MPKGKFTLRVNVQQGYGNELAKNINENFQKYHKNDVITIRKSSVKCFSVDPNFMESIRVIFETCDYVGIAAIIASLGKIFIKFQQTKQCNIEIVSKGNRIKIENMNKKDINELLEDYVGLEDKKKL